MGLHNFLVIQRGYGKDDLADAAEGFEPITDPPAPPVRGCPVSALTWRTDIAKRMHDQYISYLDERASDMAELEAAQRLVTQVAGVVAQTAPTHPTFQMFGAGGSS